MNSAKKLRAHWRKVYSLQKQTNFFYMFQTCVAWCTLIWNWSRHMVKCRTAQETRGMGQTSVCFTGVKKMLFSCICSLTLPEQKHTVWIPSGWVPSNSKFELNPPSRSCLQSSSYFLRILFFLQHFLKSLYTCFDGLPWNLEHY